MVLCSLHRVAAIIPARPLYAAFNRGTRIEFGFCTTGGRYTWLMLSIYRYSLFLLVGAAILLILRYGYLAATESVGPKKARATLVATLAFASLFVVLPLWWTGYEAQLPVFEFDGIVESVHIQSNSSKHYSAWLSIVTSSGGTISVHAPGRSIGWSTGQHLRVRYYGDTGELIQATFLDQYDKEEGNFRSASWMARAWSILIGAFLMWAAWVRYKRDPDAEIETHPDEFDSRIYGFDEEPVTQEDLHLIQAHANRVQIRYKKWALISTGAFLASCGLVWPFLAGNPLHRYWDTMGIFFLFLAQILLLPFAVSLGWAVNAWIFARKVKG